ncbi:MAG: hypothetical protein DRH17_13555 [Deltaproteobacteria bacterium]|nr:MAG: hypothetical protein DRH17_13555 [Deltaproteobacteria bacterium]
MATLKDEATKPRQVSTGAGLVQSHDLREQIALDRYLRGLESMSGKHPAQCLWFGRITSPGIGASENGSSS